MLLVGPFASLGCIASMELTRAPQGDEGGFSLEHSSMASEYNPVNYGAAFDDAISYDIGDTVTNLPDDAHVRFGHGGLEGGDFGFQFLENIAHDVASGESLESC